MTSYDEKLSKFALDLYDIKAIKFGEYKTKVGLMTPVYCDLRVIVSYPSLLTTLADLIAERIEQLNFDIICGVPYTALPIATTLSLKLSVPMVMRRKEAKDYGTKKIIEGSFNVGDRCLIVEDVVTSGSSILETFTDLMNSGVKATHAVVLLNREQGGEAILKKNGIEMLSLLTLTELLQILREADRIDETVCEKVADYLVTTQVDSTASIENKSLDRLKMSYSERMNHTTNQVTIDLFRIMQEKQTNLCVAADLTQVADILNLAEQIGPHVCLFKMHVDIIEDFNPNFIKQLGDIAQRHNFILFEDRKFADIGKTVQLQYSKGVYHISSWAKLVTVHSLTGSGVLDAIKQSAGSENRGVFLLAETSASGSLIDQNYVKSTLKLASEYSDLVTGIVCQSPLFVDNPGLVQLTPGVHLAASDDNLGQSYNSPENVILERGADIAVVGRGITKSSEPGVAAEKYKNILWEAYMKRVLIE